MGADTKIEWARHTMNFWYGCTALSPACDHCYAKTLVEGRMGKDFEVRQRTGTTNWQMPYRWDRAAAKAGERHGVFTLSLGDFWDNQVPIEWLVDALDVIRCTPNLDWLILTKRPQRIMQALAAALREVNVRQRGEAFFQWLKDWIAGLPPANVWLGTTAEDRSHYRQRWHHLAEIPAVLRFLSAEPLLGDLGDLDLGRVGAPDWVIAGGESGPGARPSHPQWYRDLRDQCAAAGAAFLFKQWGDWAPHRPQAGGDLGGDVRRGRVAIVHPTGQTDVEVFEATGGRSTIPGSQYMARVGKKAAGRLLDGLEHLAFPRSPALEAA